MTALTDLIDRWNTDEGKPYKGSLIDMEACAASPGSIGCMCAQGQVLHLFGGWDADRLNIERQEVADAETAKLLNISRTHAVLLRIVNDRLDGAPAAVLTDPGKVLGEKWSSLLDFWRHLDSFTDCQRAAAGAAARTGAWVAAGEDAWTAAGAAGAALRAVLRETAWGAWLRAWEVASASYEIQGADVFREKGKPLHFLPAFGFADLADIPARPAGYGFPA